MNEPHYYSRLGCVTSTQGGNLPHWSQQCATFVTFRLGDSLPEGKLAQLRSEREEWLKAHPRLLTRQDAASTSTGWSDDEEAEYRELFSERIQHWLDAGHGSCILRQAEARQIVEDALRHFAAPTSISRGETPRQRRRDVLVASDKDGLNSSHDIRYSLYAFVVMPNHVHVLFMPEAGCDGRKIVQGWKSYTAKAINRVLRRTGAVWQKESYDHLVRDVEEFNAVRAYIRGNDTKLAYDAYSL